MAEFIYQMYQARKAHGDKVILDDVTLSFYPGAKIGVVGPLSLIHISSTTGVWRSRRSGWCPRRCS